MKRLLYIIGILLLVTACASKRFTRKATKFEDAGLYQDAAEFYYEAAKRNSGNVDAKLGLRKNGQMVLDQKLTDFYNSYKQTSFKDAVYEYLDAEQYYNKIRSVGVDLEFPENNKSYYTDAKDEYLTIRYSEGLDDLYREEFDAAEAVFAEILRIDKNYKDAEEQYTNARYEPLYREGIRQLDLGHYRKAYYTFNSIIDGTGSYKQAAQLKEEALEKGTMTILVPDFVYRNSFNRDVALKLTSSVKGNLTASSNPFVKLIEPSAVKGSIYSNTGEIDLQAAGLAGISAILYANISDVAEIKGRLTKTPQRGYIRESYKTKNDAGEEIEKVTYQKTEYNEYKVTNQTRLNLDYKLVATESGTVLLSDVVNLVNHDQAHYAVYKGDKNKLVPGYWKYKGSNSPEDVVKDNKSDVWNLRNLLNSSHSLQTTNSLLNKLISEASGRIAGKIESYNPEE